MREPLAVLTTVLVFAVLASATPVMAAPQVAVIDVKGMVCQA